jgi:hypothetical protein
MTTMRLPRPVRTALTLAAALACPAAARAQVTLSITFDDPGAAYASFYGDLTNATTQAFTDWLALLPGGAPGPVDVAVSIGFNPLTTRSSGRSLTSQFFGMYNGLIVGLEGLPYELATGVDPNGAAPDVELIFQPDYLANNMFFAADPLTIPAARTDALSVLRHELGHAFGFNGFRDGTGALPGIFASSWDQWVDLIGGDPFFVGPNAMAVYGGPVPVTLGNPNHIGNPVPGPGSDLLPDLMNGVVFDYQHRYDISPLDVAILADVGALRPTAVPEPATGALLAVVVVPGVALLTRRRRR